MRKREYTPLKNVTWFAELVEVAEEETAKAREARDDAIRIAYQKGNSVADIAAAANMDRSSIHIIIQPKTCSEEGCDRQVKSSGMCNMHYTRYIRRTRGL